jgi:cytochrome P450
VVDQLGGQADYSDSFIAGSTWKRHRRIIVPAFHVKILDKFLHKFNANSAILLDRLAKHAGGPGFDIFPYMNLVTLDIICGKQLMKQRIKRESELIKAEQSRVSPCHCSFFQCLTLLQTPQI